MALTNDQRAALLGLLPDLSADDWNRPTACRGWSIHDVVAHLVEGELLFGRVYRGELKTLTAEEADPDAGVARWTHADAETLRFSLWHHGTATQRVIDSRSEDSWRRDVEVFGRPLHLRHVLRMHFFDLALHSQDIARTVGTASLWGNRTPFLVRYCLRGAPDALDAADVQAAGAVRVEVEGAGAWTLARIEGAWRLAEEGGTAAATWRTDPESLVMATTGRLEPREALERSNAEGDRTLLEQVLAGWRLKG